jgi:hypothetical protein
MSFNSIPIYLHEPAHSSKNVQLSIEDFQKDWLEIHKLGIAKKLFHYTNLEGLKGILGSRSLWFTHAGALNDPIEIQYGRDLIVNLINDLSQKESDEIFRSFFDQLKIQLSTLGNLIHHPFICCFCEEGDLLSQWRAYADSGGGYSIGFSLNSNTCLSTDITQVDDSKPLFLRRIIYKEEQQRELVLNYLNLVIPVVKKESKHYMDSPSDTYPSTVLGVQVSNILLDMMLCFKHPAFHEEKEWRMIRVTRDNFDTENLLFRGDSKNLIPFRSLYLYNDEENKEFPAASIINGPSAINDNKIAIELYLQHLSTDGNLIKVVPHKIQIKNAGYSLR